MDPPGLKPDENIDSKNFYLELLPGIVITT